MSHLPPSALSPRELPTGIFAVVMATGIVSLAMNGAGFPKTALGLFGINAAVLVILSILLLLRVIQHRGRLAADLTNHAAAPGFFTLVAAPCVFGSQCLLLGQSPIAGRVFWVIGLLFWLGLSYLMLPHLMQVATKPKPEDGLNGSWLLLVVGTQALSILACLLAPGFAPDTTERLLFAALAFWLVGSMFYLWLIALIFHRVLFFPLSPVALNPSYWISMGAVAISTLAGARLIGAAERMPLLTELLPFLKAMTLLFWATGTWWIPLLLVLGVWRHLIKGVPLSYEHGYWAVIFPLGMYTVSTQNLIRELRLPFLAPIPDAFAWISVVAWGVTFLGLTRSAVSTILASRNTTADE